MNPTTATGLALLAHELDDVDQQTTRTAYASGAHLRRNLDRDGIEVTGEVVLALLIGADLQAKVDAAERRRVVAGLAQGLGAALPPVNLDRGRVSRPVRLTLAAIARDVLAAAGIQLAPPAHDDQEG